MNLSSRRKFIKSLGLTGASLAGFPLLGPISKINLSKKISLSPIKRMLGKTGIELPILSMGVMNANNPNLLKQAWQEGIRHFDTAWVYQNGNNEKMIGRTFRDMNVNRKELILATKVLLRNGMNGSAKGERARDMLMSQFTDSLYRLQTNYVDILYIHDVSSIDQITDPAVMDAMTELKKQGKIRFCGFTTHVHWPDIVQKAIVQKFYDVLLLAWNISWNKDSVALATMKKAHDAGIGIIAMKTQCQQDWYKQGLPAEAQKFWEGNIMHTALLKWVLKNEYITTAVPGFTTFQQMEEDMGIIGNLEYNGVEKQFLTDKNVKFAINSICRHCGKCTGSCPVNADIPTLMRTHMYSLSYGNPLMANQTLQSITSGRGLDACKGCDTCTAKCERNVNIASRIQDLKEIYC